MGMPTLLDIARANGVDPVVGLIEEATKSHPEISDGFARTIKGLNYKTLVRTANPTVAFRSANEGSAVSKGTYENRLVSTFLFNPIWEADKAVCAAYEDGPAAYLAMEGAAVMEAAFQLLCAQMYYGTANDAKGFPGLVDAVDTTNMVVDAGGTTASTGSSVWALRWGARECAWVFGNNGELTLSDALEVRLLDTNSNPYLGYHQEILARPGFQVANIKTVGRIRDLTADSGKGLTDDLLASLLSKFPAGIVPDAFYMSRRSLSQLQQSRTATNATGAPAPFPTEAFGVPIKVTDAILDTETLS